MVVYHGLDQSWNSNESNETHGECSNIGSIFITCAKAKGIASGLQAIRQCKVTFPCKDKGK